jgi:alpha-L-rhamnosidase
LSESKISRNTSEVPRNEKPLIFPRREFSGFLLAAGAMAALPLSGDHLSNQAEGASLDLLATQFKNPPLSAAPQTYWMWMNGNITREGITLDLEAASRCGIFGVYIYNVAVGIPRGPIDYGTSEWTALVHHAISEATRLGLKVAMHNAPGYSGTGGPWIPPEKSMQELVWTETIVDSEGQIDIPLPQPHAHAGYYKDVSVIAIRRLPLKRW